MSRKYHQISTYSKIMKRRRETGEVQEITKDKVFGHNQMDEEQHKPYKAEEQPDGDWEDEFEDVYEEQEGWISDSQGQAEE